VTRLPRWRIAAALLILGVMAVLFAVFTPIYIHNMKLQNYVAGLTHRADLQARSDDLVRTLVLDQAHKWKLPVVADNVLVSRAPDGTVQKVDVRYFVPVDLPGYTVKLHFYPGAGSR